jgi:Ca2+-binding RTX toxin-like protein
VSKFEESVALFPRKNGVIGVSDDQRMHALKCAGKKPTLTNLDRIVFTTTRSGQGSFFTLADAPAFGPGATPHDAGGMGINFVVKGYAVQFGLVGTDANDSILLGDAPGDVMGVDFIPDEPFSGGVVKSGVDAKVTATRPGALILGGKGNDTISAYNPDDPDFIGTLSRGTASLYGEDGNDRLIGGKSSDYLDGGNGFDSLFGGPGVDLLTGGPGIDNFHGGPGNDEIDAIDKTGGETIDCGAGKDLSNQDLKDIDSNCEKFLFP